MTRGESVGKLWGLGPRSHESIAGLRQPVTQGRPTPDPESPLCSPHTSGSAARPPGEGETPGWSAPPPSAHPRCSRHRGWWAPVLPRALPGLVPFHQVVRAPCLRAHGAAAQGLAPGLRPQLGHPLALQGLKQVTPAVAPAQGSHGDPQQALAMNPALPVPLEPSASAVVLEQDTGTWSPRG